MKTLLKTVALGAVCALPAMSVAGNAQTQTLHHWLVRGRLINVSPEVKSDTITNIQGKVSHVSKQLIPELDFSYFFTPHIAAELILGTARHHLIATNTIAGTVDLGKIRVLPPTLTVQYHFMPMQRFSPYIGAGINYTAFYDKSLAGANPLITNIHYKNSIGLALQAGMDYNINSRWSINFDVKKLYIKTTATVDLGSTSVSTKVRLNPWVYGVGIGYRF